MQLPEPLHPQPHSSIVLMHCVHSLSITTGFFIQHFWPGWPDCHTLRFITSKRFLPRNTRVTWKHGSINRNMNANQGIIPDSDSGTSTQLLQPVKHAKCFSVTTTWGGETRRTSRFCAVIFLGRWAWIYSVTHRFPESLPTGNRRRESALVLCDWMHYCHHLQRMCPVHPLSSLFILHRSQVIQLTFALEAPGRLTCSCSSH